MISMLELTGKDKKSIGKDILTNLTTLHTRINQLRTAWGRPMIVTSGLRDMKDHLRIYRQKGIFNEKLVPMKSRHLIGAAVDILDVSGELMKWCKDNEELLVGWELWCEEGTRGWVHFQIFPPKSGKRWFLP